MSNLQGVPAVSLSHSSLWVLCGGLTAQSLFHYLLQCTMWSIRAQMGTMSALVPVYLRCCHGAWVAFGACLILLDEPVFKKKNNTLAGKNSIGREQLE